MACGPTASWSSTSGRSSPKRMLSSQTVPVWVCVCACMCVRLRACVCVLCFLLFHTSPVPLGFALQLSTKCCRAFGMKTKGTRPWIRNSSIVFSKRRCHTLVVTGEWEKKHFTGHARPASRLFTLIIHPSAVACERRLSASTHLHVHLCVYLSQQDAQEFLRFLLDKLHTEINRRPFVRRPLKEPEQKYTRFRCVISSFFHLQTPLDKLLTIKCVK